jgi:membrane-associated phospholipid phosphatase
MFSFQSMNQVTLWISATVFFLLLLSIRTNPFAAVAAFLRELFVSRKYLFHFLAMLGILMLNKIEQLIEKGMLQIPDYTPSIFRFEGGFVAGFQHLFENQTLTFITTFFYVVIFPSLMITSIGIYTYKRNFKLLYAMCYALMFNYMIAIPFYLFFPVNEVWFFHPDVKLLILNYFPTFESEYRPLSGLDNCFPSLHTSISVSMAVLALKSGNAFWKWFTRISACVIIFSIFYLGIHWLTDMLGGLVLGLTAGMLGLRIAEGRRLFDGGYLAEPLKDSSLGK